MRKLLSIVGALLLATFMVAPVMAQDATPAASPAGADLLAAADLGLPELTIVYDGTAFQAPAETAAGRYLVTVTNNDPENVLSFGFLKDPGGMSLADMTAEAQVLNDPEAGPEVFSWIYDKVFAGGANAAPGQTAQAILDLGPGHWFLINEDSDEAPSPVAEMNVTGEMPAELPEVEATATFAAISTADGYDFAVTGQVTTGTQIIGFINKTDQVHFLGTFQTSEPITFDQFMEIMMMDPSATPAPDSDIANVQMVNENGPSTPVISDGVTMWAVVSFEAGHWNAVCFMPEERSADGIPHAMEGMFESFEVA